MNLREQAENDLAETLEGEFSLPVELVAPDGSEISARGQVIYDQIKINPSTGEEMIVNEPVITLRRSSLSRVPVAGEKWLIRYPQTPSETSALAQGVLSAARPPDGGASLGVIRLYPQKVKQS